MKSLPNKLLPFLILSLLSFLPACNFGSFSYGSKPASYKGSPTQQSGIFPVPVKFQVKINNETASVVPFDLGVCSPAMTVEAVTTSGERAAVRVRTTVTLTMTGFSASKLFSDVNCQTQLPTDGANAIVEIAKGTGSTQLYMKANTLGEDKSYSLVVASSGYQSANRGIRVDRTVQRLNFALDSSSYLTSNTSMAGGAVCETYYLNGVDGIGNAFMGSASIPARIEVKNGTGLLFPGSAGGCASGGSTVLNLSLTVTANDRKFFFLSGGIGASNTIGQAPKLSATGQYPVTDLALSIVRKAVQFQIKVAGAGTPFDLGLCSPLITLEAQAADGVVTPVIGNTVVPLNGVGPTKLFADASGNCGSQLASNGGVAQITLLNGMGSISFHMNTQIVADATSYNLVAAASGTILASPPRGLQVDRTVQKLQIGSNDTSVFPTSSNAGGAVCEKFYLNGVDGLGLTFISSTAVSATLSVFSGTGQLFTDSQCSSAGASSLSKSLTTDPNTRIFYFKNAGIVASGCNVGGTVTLRPSSTITTNTDVSLSIIPKPVQIAFSSVPSDNAFSTCSTFQFQLRDACGDSAAPAAGETDTYSVTSARTEDLSGSKPGEFYASSSNCQAGTSPSSTASISFTSSGASQSLFYKANSVPVDGNHFTVYVTKSTPISAPLALFNNIETSAILFKAELREIQLSNGFGSNSRWHLCNGPFGIQVFDGRVGKAFTKGGTVQFANSGTRHFYADAQCTSQLGSDQITISSGSNTGPNFYFKDTFTTSDGATTTNLGASSMTFTGTAPPAASLPISIRNPLEPDTSGSSWTSASTFGTSPSVKATAFQSSGKLVVVGKTTVSSKEQVFIARYKPLVAGQTVALDTGFGSPTGVRFNPGPPIPSGCPNSYVEFISSGAEAVAITSTNIFVAGTATVEDVTKQFFPETTDGEGNIIPAHCDETSRVRTRQYFVLQFNSDATDSDPVQFLGKFSGSNAGNGAHGLFVDGSKLIVAGDSSQNNDADTSMAFAYHNTSNLNQNSANIIGFSGFASSARFGMKNGSNYVFYGSAGSDIGAIEVQSSNGNLVSQSKTTMGVEFAAAISAPTAGEALLEGKKVSGNSLVLLRGTGGGAVPTQLVNDTSIVLTSASGGIAFYASGTEPDSGKILVAASVSSPSVGFRVARYSASGVADSAKYTRVPNTLTSPVAAFLYLMSDDRIFVGGSFASGVAAATLLR